MKTYSKKNLRSNAKLLHLMNFNSDITMIKNKKVQTDIRDLEATIIHRIFETNSSVHVK